MSSFEKFTADGGWVSPVIDEGGYKFTYGNTVVKLFGDEWAFMNHVEYRGDKGLMGIRVTQDFMDSLMESEYPYSFQPFPSTADTEWFVATQTRNLEEELEQINGAQ